MALHLSEKRRATSMLQATVRRTNSKRSFTLAQWQAIGAMCMQLTKCSGTPTLTSSDPSCRAPVNGYLWLNDLHPTYPMHNLIASEIVQQITR